MEAEDVSLPGRDRPLRIAAFASSLRHGSLNRRLLDLVAAAVAAAGARVDVIDLRAHPLPIYDADLQERDGIPDMVTALHDQIAASDAVVVSVPEYNGGYPALFKNVVDWVTRVDMLLFHPRYVGVVSASPGKGGGARGVAHVRDLFTNMFVTTHDGLSLPKAKDALTPDDTGALPAAASVQPWAESFVAAAIEHAAERARSAA